MYNTQRYLTLKVEANMFSTHLQLFNNFHTLIEFKVFLYSSVLIAI